MLINMLKVSNSLSYLNANYFNGHKNLGHNKLNSGKILNHSANTNLLVFLVFNFTQ